jgi:inner membrane protein
MPTVFSHAVAGLAIATLLRSPRGLGRLALVGALCAAAPDLDVLGLSFGVPWGHVLGHRGLTHSLPFAAVLAGALTALLFRGPAWRGRRGAVWLVLFLATASHGVLDAMTNGGSGVAFLAPFDDARWFLPWRPIPVSPIDPGRFFSQRGVRIMRVEVVLIWLPAVALAILGAVLRRRRSRA